MTKVVVASSLSSKSAQTVNVTTKLDNYAKLTADNFYCEVRGMTAGSVGTAETSGGSNLIPTYNASTGVVSIPKFEKAWTSSGNPQVAYMSYRVYAIY